MRKFKIPTTPATTNKTIRVPNNLLECIEEKIRGKDCTFSAFVIAAIKLALDDLKDDESQR